jgi:demethylmenaquinone methyltransferase/2-methoxy-6-polyprenyl-1,4-benzoquinol methylase
MTESNSIVTRPIDESFVAQMFNRIAKRYDFLNRLLSARQDVKWRRHLLEMVPYRPNGFYLDMATGTGDVALAVAKEHSEYKTIVGGDISQGMLEIADQKSIKAGSSKQITWSTMSAERIPFDMTTVDCVSIAFGLRNVVNKAKAISEFHRVLKSGGVLLILEFFTPQGTILSRTFQFYFHRILPVIGRLFSEKDAYTYLPKSVASFYSPVELNDALRSQGFMIDRQTSFLFGACRLVRAIRL